MSWGLTTHHPNVRPGTVFTNVACGFDGTHLIGITWEGTVVNWDSSFADPPAGLSNVVAVGATVAGINLALKSDGTVTAWGPPGPLLNVPAGLNSVKAIAAGSEYALALRSNGTVVAWGGDGGFVPSPTNVPPGLADVVGIAAGWAHSVALKGDGTLVAWGDNSYGQTDVPSGLSNVTQVAAGSRNTLALTADGSVVAWGDANNGVTDVPSDLTGVVQVDCGYDFAVALRDNGTLSFWGGIWIWWVNDEQTTNLLAGLRDVVEISVGGGSGVARKRDGTFVSWGSAVYQASVPPLVANVASLGSSRPGTRFLTAQGQLLPYHPIYDPRDLTNIAAFADGTGDWVAGVINNITLAALKDGTVVAWGDNTFGQLDVPEGLSNVVNVAAGYNYSVALKSDGTVVVWGGVDNEFGGTTEVTNVPAGLSDVRSVAAGPHAILALRGNGMVVAWGDEVPAGQPDAERCSGDFLWILALRRASKQWHRRGVGMERRRADQRSGRAE